MLIHCSNLQISAVYICHTLNHWHNMYAGPSPHVETCSTCASKLAQEALWSRWAVCGSGREGCDPVLGQKFIGGGPDVRVIGHRLVTDWSQIGHRLVTDWSASQSARSLQNPWHCRWTWLRKPFCQLGPLGSILVLVPVRLTERGWEWIGIEHGCETTEHRGTKSAMAHGSTCLEKYIVYQGNWHHCWFMLLHWSKFSSWKDWEPIARR